MIQIINWLSLSFGLIPFNRQVITGNMLVDYLMMAVMPIIYLACYLHVNFIGSYAVLNLEKCESICKLSTSLFMHLGAFLYISVALQSLLRLKRFFFEFEQSLQEIDALIEKCRKIAEIDKTKITPAKHSVACYLTLLFVFSIFVLAVYSDIKELYTAFGKYAIMPLMVSSFPYLAGSIMQGEFMCHVSVISKRFAHTNMLFEKINLEARRQHTPLTVFDIESEVKKEPPKLTTRTITTHTTKSTYGRTEKLNAEPNQAPGAEANDATEDKDAGDDYDDDDYGYDEATLNTGVTSEANLPDLFKLHDKILQLSVLTNGEFGPQCVPFMGACFVISIFAIFLQAKVNFIVGGRNYILDYITHLYVIWSFTTMTVAYLVLRSCCNANKYSKQSAMTVHEIMQKKPAFMLSNDLFYNKMKSFTLQFLHWEGYFQFNGIGLFALDYTFIFSTVSAATSYLIVLLQFDMTTILKNENLL